MLKKGSRGARSSRGSRMFSEDNSVHKFSRIKNTNLLDEDDEIYNTRNRQDQLLSNSNASSPYNDRSSSSPMDKSPWSSQTNVNVPFEDIDDNFSDNVLMGSLVREEGHIYSLATSGDVLYTGSDSRNIRVWKNRREFAGFKSNSGLVKAIVISDDRIFTGHQDGKIRVWKVSSRDPSVHKRVGTLPTMKDYIKNSMKISNYFEVKRHKNASGEFPIPRCIESVIAHDDSVNSIITGFDGLVFTGSADGTVKVWRRELQGKGTKHFFSQTLLKQECAVTAVAVNPDTTVVYSGSSDGLVNFWERENHLSHGGVLRGHKLAVLCLITAGNLVFSGSADMGICVWRRMGMDHICLSLLTGHNGPVKCLAAERDDESAATERRWILYSGSLDKSVKMWRVSENSVPVAWKGCASGAPIAIPSSLPAAPSFEARNRVDGIQN
ncbi:F-BOX AND WD40 DOMAIN PROTEIN [Salix koriyanagi]|uniref:F-BOX AND WD40 DOMAIN PROTEIN n=1 Tax=Salix koriyanagi TaxID=2511006 RepID=A0A9Q0SLR0_9ROSI|nr:F-BOX AND WD40 DOMAIN PROTEIN [Salix koriyanagi]